jgi:hypothetical protein
VISKTYRCPLCKRPISKAAFERVTNIEAERASAAAVVKLAAWRTAK